MHGKGQKSKVKCHCLWVLHSFSFFSIIGQKLQLIGVGRERLPLSQGPTKCEIFSRNALPQQKLVSLPWRPMCSGASLPTPPLPASPTLLCGKLLRNGPLAQEALDLPQYPASAWSAKTFAELNPEASFQHHSIYCLPAEWSSRTVGVLGKCWHAQFWETSTALHPRCHSCPNLALALPPGKSLRLLRGTHQSSGVHDLTTH